jgi:hypothetical protein
VSPLRVQPLLLEEAEESGYQVDLQVFTLRCGGEVEDLVVLAEAIRESSC